MQPHTAAKHTILRKYLGAWLPIIVSTEKRILIVDGFAGPGVYENGEEGSPIIILKEVLAHPRFRDDVSVEVNCLFIELDQRVAAELKAQIEALKGFLPFPPWLKVYQEGGGAFDKVLTEILNQIGPGEQLIPTFAFIDPFGIKGVPLETVSRLVKNPKAEVLITWMFEAMERWAKTPEFRPHLDAMFGGDEWNPIVTQKSGGDLLTDLSNLYERKLREVAELKHIRTFEMKNNGNRTEYLLFFGTNHPKGLSKMKDAMWKVDPLGGETFFDRTDPNQMMLIGEGSQVASQLRKMLLTHFTGKGFEKIDEWINFVIVGTPFLESHLKKKTLGPMEKEEPAVIEVKRPTGKRERLGEYPPGTRIRVLGKQ
jgi:three-Cys-motif partner protein